MSSTKLHSYSLSCKLTYSLSLPLLFPMYGCTCPCIRVRVCASIFFIQHWSSEYEPFSILHQVFQDILTFFPSVRPSTHSHACMCLCLFVSWLVGWVVCVLVLYALFLCDAFQCVCMLDFHIPPY